MLFSLPRKRGINIAKIRGNKVTDYSRRQSEPSKELAEVVCRIPSGQAAREEARFRPSRSESLRTLQITTPQGIYVAKTNINFKVSVQIFTKSAPTARKSRFAAYSRLRGAPQRLSSPTVARPNNYI